MLLVAKVNNLDLPSNCNRDQLISAIKEKLNGESAVNMQEIWDKLPPPTDHKLPGDTKPKPIPFTSKKAGKVFLPADLQRKKRQGILDPLDILQKLLDERFISATLAQINEPMAKVKKQPT